ncbi:MAG: hypothetical protein N3G21_05825 [Candidatus Hydrogenedentes bacterium]|nr:hypothetical protein [Candidatus Hydrogenedentota bacterium]
MGCVKKSYYRSLYLFSSIILLTYSYTLFGEPNFPIELQDLMNSKKQGYEIHALWDERAPKNENSILKGAIIRELSTNKHYELYYLNGKLLSQKEKDELGITNKDLSKFKEVSVSSENFVSPHYKQREERFLTQKEIEKFIRLDGVELITLPPLAKEKLIEEDSKSIVNWEKGIYRIGIIEKLPEDIIVIGENTSHGNWRILPDGSFIWALDIHFPHSIGMRINIQPLSKMSNSVSFLIIPIRTDTQCIGPLNADTIHSLSNWLPTCFSDKVRVICRVEPDSSISEADFEISEVIGIYQDPIQILSKAGSCNLDFTCYPNWSEIGKGVVGLGVVSQPYALFCTGTLIADNDPCTQIPYILTANHCVNSQSGYRGADTVEFYWFYQTSTCNGTPPSLSSVPRTTGGADYLVGMGGSAYYGGGNDFTLMRMRNSPPEDSVFVGWTTAILAIGTQVTDIHHPSGSYKRISFGRKTNNDNPYSLYYHEVTWDQGTTEPGSSGSPLLLTNTKQIIGQLWGGGASCNTPTEPDYFGRFDVTYRLAKDFLEPPAVKFAETSFVIEEQNYTKNVMLTLSSPARSNSGEVTLKVETENASSGIDYTLSSTTVNFTPNSTQSYVTIQIIDNTHTEPEKKIKLTLESPQCLRLAENNLSFELVIQDNDTDTDGDGISDYDEINGIFGFPSDPNKVDSDYDGLTDYDELMSTHGYATNPTSRDTDGDGVSDWVEIHYGTDPTDSLDFVPFESQKIPWFKDVKISTSNLNPEK